MFKHRAVDLLITADAAAKQQSLVDECEGEVGWFGLVDKVISTDPDGKELELDRVYDLLVPEQEVSYGHVDHEGFDLNEFLEAHQDVAHEMKYYGHSHVHGVCRPSFIDLNQIDTWEEYGLPYFYSTILNKYGEFYGRMDQWEPRRSVTPVNLRVEIPKGSRDWASAQRMEVVHHLTAEEFNKKYKTTSY